METLFRLLAHLPLCLLHGVGNVLGWLVFVFSTTYRRRFLENAAQAGVGWRQWLPAVGHAGKMVAELPRIWLGRPVRIVWEGEDHIVAALQNGRGLVCLTPHLGCFEITAQAYAQRYGQGTQAVTVLFRPARQTWLRGLVAQARQRPGLKTAPTNLSGVKQLIKALRSGQTVGLLPDQVPPAGLGVVSQFFGREAYTMTLSARLVQQTGASVVLIWGERLSWGRGYRIHIKPLDGSMPGEIGAAVQAVNQAMQGMILQCPQQYLWGYARYKIPQGKDLATGQLAI